MATLTRRLGAAALVTVAVGLLTATPALPPLKGAPPPLPRPRPNPAAVTPLATTGPVIGNPIQPNRPIGQLFPYRPLGINSPYTFPVERAAFHIATLGQAYSFVPPYALGYNPYPQAVNFGTMYNPGL